MSDIKKGSEVNFRISGVVFVRGIVVDENPTEKTVRVKSVNNPAQERWVNINSDDIELVKPSLVISRDETGPEDYQRDLEFQDSEPIDET